MEGQVEQGQCSLAGNFGVSRLGGLSTCGLSGSKRGDEHSAHAVLKYGILYLYS